MANKRKRTAHKSRLPIPPRRSREGSKADIAQDKRGAKARGMSMKQWEGSPEDQAQDAAAGPGPNEFNAGQEQSMRQSARQTRLADVGGVTGGPYPDEDLG